VRRRVNELELAYGPWIIASWQDRADAYLPIGAAENSGNMSHRTTRLPLVGIGIVVACVVAPILLLAELLVLSGVAFLLGFGLLVILSTQEVRHEREFGTQARVDRALQLLSD
jgi:hypothetical protein